MNNLFAATCIGIRLFRLARVELASFPGAEEGEEKEHLVHTVCACA